MRSDQNWIEGSREGTDVTREATGQDSGEVFPLRVEDSYAGLHLLTMCEARSFF